MASDLYIIIPYESDVCFSPKDIICRVYEPDLPELKNIDSDLKESLSLLRGFICVDTFSKGGFDCMKNGYCHLRAESYKLAKALGADEVWYVLDEMMDEMDMYEFDFEKWKKSLNEELKNYTKEVNLELIRERKWAAICHDDFSDIVLEIPTKNIKKRKRKSVKQS